MDNEKENLQNEPGSVQRQTQNNQQYADTEGGQQQEVKEKNEEGTFDIIPVQQAESSDADIDREGDRSIRDKDEIDLKDIDDEKIIPGIKAKRSPWNSITFDSDDFFGGMIPT